MKLENGKKRLNVELFDDWSEAFDYCREVDHPVVAQVGTEVGKVFPSGWYNYIGKVTTNPPD